jgi:hypothetical protein
MVRRLTGMMIALVCVLILGGCAVPPTPESRLDEYKAESETLAMSVVELIPVDLEPALDTELESRGQAPQNGVTAEKRPGDPAWWQARAYVSLVEWEGAAAEAIAAVTEAMKSDGWTVERVRETGEGRTITDGFRRDDWYVEIAWVKSEPGKVERFDISVVSPTTVRGDHEGISS